MRLDLLITLLLPERSLDVAPHGLIGQTFDGSDVGVDGAVDPKPQRGERMTTKAMAEGSSRRGRPSGTMMEASTVMASWCEDN